MNKHWTLELLLDAQTFDIGLMQLEIQTLNIGTFTGCTNIGHFVGLHLNFDWINTELLNYPVFMLDMTSLVNFVPFMMLIYSGLYLNPQILLRGPQLLGNEQPM